jgi:hypothetical protein
LSVSRAKLKRELDAWQRNAVDYRRRGMVILRADDLVVEVAFFGLLPIGSAQLPVVAPTIRLEFDNYDLWPPSVQFIDSSAAPRLLRPCPRPSLT